MNGPEHYLRAEVLEQLAVRQFEGSREDEVNPLWQLTIAQAQVHATLALAAATAFASAGVPADGMAALAWRRTIDPRPVITNHPAPTPHEVYECCASGSCEVCRA